MPDKHDWIDQAELLLLMEIEAENLQLEIDIGRAPRPFRYVYAGVDRRTGKSRWSPYWLRGEVLAAQQALALRRVGGILNTARKGEK